MATVTSGSFDTTHRISGSYNTYAHFSWSVQSTDSTGTTISYKLTGKTASDYQWIQIYGTSIVINGVNQQKNWTGQMYNGTQMASGTYKIPHTGEKTFSASVTIQQYASGENYSGSGSWTIAAVATAPAAPTVTLDSFTDTTATISMAVSDYGNPPAASGRKLRGAVLGLNAWSDPCRYEEASNTSSATVTISNTSSTGSNPLTIMGNTQYYYGASANNTALSTSTVAASPFVTLPAYITGVTAVDDGNHNMNISVLHANEGSAQTVYTEYSYDQTNWNLVQDQFHLTVNTPTTIYFRRSNNSGYTPVYSTVVSPDFPVKLYGSVNGTTHQVTRLYGSVNGTTHKINRLYGSVNGVTQLVYEDNS